MLLGLRCSSAVLSIRAASALTLNHCIAKCEFQIHGGNRCGNTIHRSRAEASIRIWNHMTSFLRSIDQPPELDIFFDTAGPRIACSPPAQRQAQIRKKQAPILAPNLCQMMKSIIALQREPSQLLSIENSIRFFCCSTLSPLHHRLSFIHRKIHRYSAHHLQDIQHRMNSQENALQSARIRF